MSVATRTLTRQLLFFAQFPLTLALGVYNAATTTSAQWWVEWHLGRLVRFCQVTYLILVPLLLVLLLAVQALLHFLEPSQVLRAAKAVVDEVADIAFGKHELPSYERRVTLFKYKGIWGFRKLKAVARSGDTTHGKISKFRVSLNRPKDAEGVAGQAFATGQVKNTGALLPAIDATSTDEQIAAYAERTYVDVKWIKKWFRRRSQPLPRGICAIPIRAADGRPWGVLVLDASIEVKYTREASKKNFLMIANVLGKLLGAKS